MVVVVEVFEARLTSVFATALELYLTAVTPRSIMLRLLRRGGMTVVVTVLVPVVTKRVDVDVKTVLKSVSTMVVCVLVATVVSSVVVPVVTVSDSVAVGTLFVATVVVIVDVAINVETEVTVEVHGFRGNFEEQKARAFGKLESGNSCL